MVEAEKLQESMPSPQGQMEDQNTNEKESQAKKWRNKKEPEKSLRTTKNIYTLSTYILDIKNTTLYYKVLY